MSYDSIDLALPSHQRYFRFSRPFRHCIGQVCKHYDFKVTPIRFNLENYQEFLGDRLDSEAERQNWAEEIFNRSDVRVQNSSHLVKTENQKSSLESSSSSLKVSFA